jgi:hypothetical protein
MLAEKMTAALKREFPAAAINYDSPPKPIATIAAAQEAVGRIFIYLEDDEITVLVENISHAHFNPYDEDLSDEARAERIIPEVMEFLHQLLGDRILLIRSNRGGHGCPWTPRRSKS